MRKGITIFTFMRHTMIIVPLLVYMSIMAKAQVIKLDFDSVYVICKYKDLKKRIKKDNDKENTQLKLSALDSLKKTRSDTILIGRQLIFDYHRESDDLVKANKVSFFDQRNNKKVIRIEKIKEGRKGVILYYVYRDADTKNELYQILIRTWRDF